MTRYLAFAWSANTSDASEIAAVLAGLVRSKLPELSLLVSSPGLQVYRSRMDKSRFGAYLLNRDRGIVIGNLFGPIPRIARGEDRVTLDAQTTDNIVATGGRYLIDHCWGRYVAMLRDSHKQCIHLLRDPTGAMPCQISYHDGIAVLYPQVTDAAKLGLVDTTIDWSHVAAYLRNPRLVARHTGLKAVRNVQAGECITIGPEAERAAFCWRPAQIHNRGTIEDRQQAGQELRSTIQSCVAQWAGQYNTILHGLSGGLDSAVVLACLSDTPTTVICQNYFVRHAQGDERKYAQLAARNAGVELIESVISVSDRTLEEMFDPTRVASPEHSYLIPDSELERERLVASLEIEAIFSGQGGDHLFQQARSPHIAADFVRHHGLAKGAATVMVDTARLARRSVWAILYLAILYGVLLKRRDTFDESQTPVLLTDEAKAHCREDPHPWIADGIDLPINKRKQVKSIVDTQNFYSEPARYADIVHPLISQPIIELCLRIPSYVLTYAGVDRALVRDAFSGLLPSKVLHRTDKGATSGVFVELIVENISFIRHYLTHGVLSKEGLLDQKRIDSTVTEARVIKDVYALFPIVHAILAETWARHWSVSAKT